MASRKKLSIVTTMTQFYFLLKRIRFYIYIVLKQLIKRAPNNLVHVDR
jgi:hypothetical protein